MTLTDGTILSGKFRDGAFIDETPVGGTKQKIRQLETALALYRLHNGKYPTTDQKLSALLERPRFGIIPTNWGGPYLRIKKIPVDWWNNEFLYKSDGNDFEIISLGADDKQGGFGLDADISSNIEH